MPEAVASLVQDGSFVALEGFTHLIPFAAGHELLRQGRQDLTVVRLTPDVLFDQMIGLGRVEKVIFSYGGNPGVGSLHRFRDAVENGWPRAIELREHSHAGLANAYVAGASHLPFGVLRGYAGTDLPEHNDDIAFIECPFTGQRLSAVRAINPDVAIIHAQQADRQGNVQLWGLSGVQKEAVLAAKHAIVTVEEIVDDITARPRAIVLPAWVLDAVCHVPNGAWPSYAADFSVRDNAFYEEWDGIARDRDRFRQWMDDNVLNAAAPVGSPAVAR
ncbi:MAG TPA: CoA-transferase [Solirubrobacteraceae bacterium]|nr:CoA-transferase [Solirubrobacteraceae bacterium]